MSETQGVWARGVTVMQGVGAALGLVTLVGGAAVRLNSRIERAEWWVGRHETETAAFRAEMVRRDDDQRGLDRRRDEQLAQMRAQLARIEAGVRALGVRGPAAGEE